MFRFTIRELALLVVIVAMGLAWWVDHSSLSEGFRRSAWNYTWAANKLDELGYVPEYKRGRISNIRRTSKQPSPNLPSR